MLLGKKKEEAKPAPETPVVSMEEAKDEKIEIVQGNTDIYQIRFLAALNDTMNEVLEELKKLNEKVK